MVVYAAYQTMGTTTLVTSIEEKLYARVHQSGN
jgi:hypothetical protein